jgi:hypothetical protein
LDTNVPSRLSGRRCDFFLNWTRHFCLCIPPSLFQPASTMSHPNHPSQHHVTSAVTAVFTVGSSVGLIAVSAWFALERWAYMHHDGKKWLWDVLVEVYSQFSSFFSRYSMAVYKIIIQRSREDGLPTTSRTNWRGVLRPIGAFPSRHLEDRQDNLPMETQTEEGSRAPSIHIEVASIAEGPGKSVSRL